MTVRIRVERRRREHRVHELAEAHAAWAARRGARRPPPRSRSHDRSIGAGWLGAGSSKRPGCSAARARGRPGARKSCARRAHRPSAPTVALRADSDGRDPLRIACSRFVCLLVLGEPFVDDRPRHVFHDQRLAADAARRRRPRASACGSHHTTECAIVAGEEHVDPARPVDDARRDRRRAAPDRVLPERRTARRRARRRAAPPAADRSRALSGADPAAVPLRIADRRHDQQIARAGRRDVGDAHAFRLVARQLERPRCSAARSATSRRGAGRTRSARRDRRAGRRVARAASRSCRRG